ncbi:MAG: cell division protein FtsL [Burkholderiaceae bacterium]|jgi:cell division protein FtsL|nr:cell division protein FtsL [Burkholderiaceae bacterium]
MTRLNLILFAVLILSSLSLVTSQHKSRKLIFELQQQQETAKFLNTEWSQLQLEQGTWAMHSRLEQVASDLLHMHVPDTKHIQIVAPDDVPLPQSITPTSK